MCCLLAVKDSYRRIGPTEEAVLTLPLLDHPCAAILSTYVWMCAKGGILGAKSRICMSSASVLRSFIVTYPVGLEEDTRRAWVVMESVNSKQITGPLGIDIHLPSLNPMHW